MQLLMKHSIYVVFNMLTKLNRNPCDVEFILNLWTSSFRYYRGKQHLFSGFSFGSFCKNSQIVSLMKHCIFHSLVQLANKFVSLSILSGKNTSMLFVVHVRLYSEDVCRAMHCCPWSTARLQDIYRNLEAWHIATCSYHHASGRCFSVELLINPSFIFNLCDGAPYH